jgi:YHS domain-containing protein
VRLLVILFLAFVLYLVVKVSIGFAFLSSQRRKRREELGGEMVQDPICNTYIPRSRAIEKTIGGQTVYFCSQPCVDAFFEKRRAS